MKKCSNDKIRKFFTKKIIIDKKQGYKHLCIFIRIKIKRITSR